MAGDSFDPDKSSGHGELLVRLDQQQMRLLELAMPSRVPMASTEGSNWKGLMPRKEIPGLRSKNIRYWMGKEGLGCYDPAEDFILVR